MTDFSTPPQLYRSLHAEQRQVLRWCARVMLISLVGFGVLRTMPLATFYLGKLATDYPELKPIHRTLATWFGETAKSSSLAVSNRVKSRFVLGDTSLLNDLRFTVNVPTNLKGGVSVTGDTQVTGDLAVTGDVSAAGISGSTASIQGALSAGSLTAGSLTTTGNLQAGNITRVRGITYSFPSAQGSSNTFLRNDGSGTLTWQTISIPSIPSIPSKYSDLSGGEIKDASGITSSGTITFSSFSTNGGLLYTNGSGTLAQTTAGTANQCLISSGGGAPTWSSCAAGANDLWSASNGAIIQNNTTMDLLIGGTATESAKFALLNVNTGTPTASISAGTTGAFYLTATGSAQTTNRQNMTLGGGTTGNIIIANRNNTPLMSVDTVNNGIGIGTAAQQDSKLTIAQNVIPSGISYYYGTSSQVNANNTGLAFDFSKYYGVTGSASVNGSTQIYNSIQGVTGSAGYGGTNSAYETSGGSFYASNQSTGTATHLAAVESRFTNTGTGTVGSAFGFRVKDMQLNSGTMTNTYGVYVGDITAGTQTNTPFSFYAVDANTYNYFAGRVGIGTTTPNNLLQVLDLVNFDNTNTTTKLGYQAGKNIVTGAVQNTFVGYEAGLSSATLSTNTADRNSAFGYQAFTSNTTGAENTAAGYRALKSNTTGSFNTAYGTFALNTNTTGSDNTAVGDSALNTNSTGYKNVAIGEFSLFFNTTGYHNTASGYDVLDQNTTGFQNTAAGYLALFYNQTGSNNVVEGALAGGYGAGAVNSFSNSAIFGASAGYNITTGSNNTFLGYKSGESTTTGAKNIVLGYDIDLPANSSSNMLNIGNLIYATGLDGVNTTMSTGSVGIGTTAPSAVLDVQKTVTTTAATGVSGWVTTTATNANTVYGGVFESDTSNISSAINVTGITGVRGRAQHADIGTTTSVIGVEGRVDSNLGTTTNAYAFYGNASLLSTTVTNAYSFYGKNPVKVSSTLTNNYGLYLEGQTSGTNNYAIYTNAGLNQLGDQLSVIGSADRKQLIVKANATQTANLQEWQDSSGTALASISSAGVLTNSVSTGDTTGVNGTSFSLNVNPSTTNALTAATGSRFSTQVTGSATTQSSLTVTGIQQTVLVSGTMNTAFGINTQTNTGIPGTSTTVSSAMYGARIESFATATTTTPNMTGLLVQAGATTTAAGTSAITNITGIESKLSNTGIGSVLNTTNSYGIRSNLSFNAFSGATFTIANMHGLYVDPITSASVTSTNRYGLYLGAVSGASTDNYSIYSAGGVNYFNDSIGIGTTSFGTSAAKVLAIAGSTAPTTAITDGVQLFAVDQAGSHELRVMDEAGNVTTLSPHNFSLIPEGRSEDLAWSFYSERQGKAINVDMTRALRVVEDLSGEQLVFLKDLQTNEETVASRSGVSLTAQVAGIQTHISLTEGMWTFLKDVAFSAKAKFMGVVEFLAEVQFKAETTFERLTTFNGALRVSGDTAGSVVIPSQATKVRVLFEKPFSKSPEVSLFAPKQTSAKFELVEVSPTAFVIELKQALAEPLTIQWWAVESSATQPASVEVLEENGVAPTSVPSPSPSAAPQSLLPSPTPISTPSVEPVASPVPSPTPEPSITPTATSSAEPAPEQSTPSATLP